MRPLARLLSHVALAALGLWPGIACAEEAARRLETEPPEGFESLLAARERSAAVFVDGREIGAFAIETSPGFVRFRDPEAVFAKLPAMSDPGPVMAALRGDLASNAGLSCVPVPSPGCGRVETRSAAIIYAREAERIDLFLPWDLRAPTRPFLPDPEDRFAAAGALDLSYTLVGNRFSLYCNPQAVFGRGRAHLTVQSNVSERGGAIDTLFLRRVGNDHAVTFGLQSAEGFQFIFPNRLAGLRIASTSDTRLDRARMADTPLVFDAALPGRLEIRRDGRVLASQAIQPGLVAVDTGMLPEGAYPLTLHILDASGERTEERFFTRGAGLAPIGAPSYFAEVGAYAPFQFNQGGLLPALSTPVARAGLDLRVGPQTSVSARVEASTQRNLIELGGAYFGDGWRLNGALAATGERDLAVGLSVNGAAARFSWALNGRLVQSERGVFGDITRGLAPRYAQVGAQAGWNGKASSLGLSGFWRRDLGGATSYSVLPYGRFDLGGADGRRWRLDVTGDASRDRWTVRVALNLSINRPGRGLSLIVGGETGQQKGNAIVRPAGSLDANISQKLAGNTVIWRAGASRFNGGETTRVGATLASARLTASADAQWNGENAIVFGRLNTLAGFDGRTLAFGAGQYTGAGLVARVDGASKKEEFTVRAPSSSMRTVRGGQTVFVAIPPFQAGDVALDATGGASRFGARAVRVVFFPGAVARVTRTAQRSYIAFGQLVDGEGRAFAGASIASTIGVTETDAEGRFTLEVAHDDQLTVESGLHLSCRAPVKIAPTAEDFVQLGTVACAAT